MRDAPSADELNVDPGTDRKAGKMRTIRVRLACSTEAEFERRVLPRLSSDGLFIPTPSPPTPHERVNLKLELQSGRVLTAEVEATRPASSGGKAGFIAQLVKLAPPPPPPPPPEPEPEPDTCVYHYSKGELRAAASGAWTGGLRPFDRFGRYQLLMRLGAGSAAEVFLARAALAVGAERLAVLKVLRPQRGPASRYASLFVNEARVGLTLQHPNLAQIYDFGEAQGRPFLAMEYIEGATVADLLSGFTRAGHTPPVPFAVRVAVSLCRALEYVHAVRDLGGHSLNLVHRDVRAGNVLVSETGEIKLLDFGVVASRRTPSGSAEPVGPRGAICPEQARGGAPAPSWDVYALGTLLDQLLTLRPPAALDSALAAPLRAPPSAFNPGVPPELDRAVLAATDLAPDRRPRSARELRALLEQAGDALPSPDVGALCRTMQGAQLAARKAEVERLVASARRHEAPRVALGRALLRPVRALGRRPKALGAVAALLVSAAVASGWAVGQTLRAEREVRALLTQADEQVVAARLLGQGGETALGSLLAARRLRPGDERVEQRLRTLADARVRLATSAEQRGDAAEALVHLEGALQADPERPGLARRLLEARARRAATATARSSP
ncbi:MAG TPA: protein kinase [Myxococcales bacterium]